MTLFLRRFALPASAALFGGLWFAGQQNPAWLIVLGPLAFTLAGALFTAAARGHRAALFGLAALTLVDHGVYGATIWWWDPPQTLADYRASIPKPTVVPPNRVVSAGNFGFRSTAARPWAWWSSTRLIVHDARLVSGYAGLMPAKQLDYRTVASLRVAGAAAVVKQGRFDELPGALPRARLVTRAVATASPQTEISAIDVATTALVDEPVELEAGAAGEATIEQDDPGEVRIATHAATRQLLVVAESFHSGWRLEVDGEQASVIRVYGDFMGAVVEAGAHELQFRFAPRSYALGRALSFAGLAVVAAVALTGVRAAGRPHLTPAPPT